MKKDKISLLCYSFVICITILSILFLIFIGRVLIFSNKEEPLPNQVIIYDRTNKAVVTYNAVSEVRGEVLYVEDAIETKRKDVSDLIE